MSDVPPDRRLPSPLVKPVPTQVSATARPVNGVGDLAERAPDANCSLRTLAHELNSLLDGSLRTLRLTRRAMSLGEPTPETVSATSELEAVESAMVRMAEALRRVLLTPSQPSAGEVVHALASDLPLDQTVADLFRHMEPLAQSAGVTLRIECDPPAGALPTGPLEPLLRNAIRNSIEAFHLPVDSPCVTVSLRRRGDRLAIDVLDNGPGLSASLSVASPSSTKGGCGLGLEVAREVVRSLAGTLELSNVPFGRGAVLRAEVPVQSLVQTPGLPHTLGARAA